MTQDNGTLQVVAEMRNVRHEMEALVLLNRMLGPWLVIGHPKGLPHGSTGAPHVCGDVKNMKPYRQAAGFCHHLRVMSITLR